MYENRPTLPKNRKISFKFHTNYWKFTKNVNQIFWNFEFGAVQRIANLVDLEKCWKMSIWLQKSALIQPRTSPLKFEHFGWTNRSKIRYRTLVRAKSSNFRRLVLGCIEADFCNQILIFQRFLRSTRFTILCTASNSIFFDFCKLLPINLQLQQDLNLERCKDFSIL